MTRARLARLSAGVNADDAARRAGLARSSFDKIERGRVPSETVARTLARLYGCPMTYLAGARNTLRRQTTRERRAGDSRRSL